MHVVSTVDTDAVVSMSAVQLYELREQTSTVVQVRVICYLVFGIWYTVRDIFDPSTKYHLDNDWYLVFGTTVRISLMEEEWV